MISEQRAMLVEALSTLCDRYPHWRFGQLLSNVAGWADADVWNVEDEQLVAAIQLHLNQLNSSKISVASGGGDEN
jgi:hypothetical protein